MGVIASCPVHQNGRVEQFATTSAFPGIKRTDKIVKFFSKHTALAAWTLHNKILPFGLIAVLSYVLKTLQQTCQKKESHRPSKGFNTNIFTISAS